MINRPLALLMGLVLLPVVLLGSYSFAPYRVAGTPSSGASGTNAVYVVSHGWHTGLIVPAAPLRQALPALQTRFGDAAYYEIGWGDKGFYQATEVTAGLTLQAMFWSSGAVMHVVGIPADPASYFQHSDIKPLCLNPQQLAGLATFISNSFARHASGELTALKAGIYGDSQFYAASGRYHLLNTCNSWTAKGLSSAGLGIAPAFKLTAGSVMGSVEAGYCQ
ncbi:MAG: TIGR02117 family protein [Candidatus Thiothrix putei]|uniref:TIGR02117 family protein n=1 Tax=Candidatus Thiothrix putei TaxID=3080811 RepID=A0AA95HDR3_9GAMM|nr:MAG: TIGR02117 family protein [Candidatus Thiothrix putei]